MKTLLFVTLLTTAPMLFRPIVKNLHQVTEFVYRSGQPHRKEMKELERMGIKTIINLRNVMDDERAIKGTTLRQIRIPMQAKEIDYNDILTALRTINEVEKPVLIHCLHGSDRTGAVCAAYRMVFDSWSREEAINDFLEEKYSYNQLWFPNILELLQDLDVNQLRKELNL